MKKAPWLKILHMAPGVDEYVDLSAALPPWLHLWGVAERSESFKIMIAGGNHSTTDVLISIGVRDYKIYFGGSKIDKILEKDNSMDIDTIKQAINLLENQF